MAYGEGAAVAAAAAAAIARAIKASGAIVSLEPAEFARVLNKAEKPLVIMSVSGWRKKNYDYLMAYKGLILYTRSSSPLLISSSAETIVANKIWIPG